MQTVAVSIIIPTRNRFEVLEQTLRRFLVCLHPSAEVIVYDDGSDENNIEKLRSLFPDERFTFFRSETPCGPAELRNRMIQTARTDTIFGFDDDSYFPTKEDFEGAIRLFSTLPDAAVLGFCVISKKGIEFPKCLKAGTWQVSSFLSGAFVGRKKALLEAGGFDSFFFRGGEERDLAIRLLDRGWNIYLTRDVTVFHERSPVARDEQFIAGHTFRNGLFFYLKHFSGFRRWLYLAKHFLMHLFFCFFHGWFRAIGFALRSFVRDYRKAVRQTKAVRKQTMMRYIKLRRYI